MEEIVKILMERDGNTREEALSIIEDVKEMMEEVSEKMWEHYIISIFHML